MTTAMEQALWRKQKQPIIQSFITEQKKFVSAVAGNGWLQAPGFLYEGETGLEVDAKQKLSGIGYAILKEAVERDMKQYGIDMDSAFKTAQMAWELEKAELMNDWDKELSWVKKGWAQSEEEMDQLAIEVSRRGITLIEAKTAIELQKEALRAQLAGLEDDSADYEVELANQKLLTANKKLEVIPILQQILAVEEDILDQQERILDKDRILLAREEDKIGYLQDLVEAQTEIAEKKEDDLLPVMQELILKNEELAGAIADQIVNEVAIMAQKVLDAGIMVEKAKVQVQIAETQEDEETARLRLLNARIDLAEAKRDRALALQKQETRNLAEVIEIEEEDHTLVMDQELLSQSNFVNLKTETATSRINQDVNSSMNLTNKSVETEQGIADIRSDKEVRVASLQATAKISSQLQHLIG